MCIRDRDYEDVLLGYILWDEPKIPQFSLIKQRIGWVREIDPDVRLYLNLLPSYNAVSYTHLMACSAWSYSAAE